MDVRRELIEIEEQFWQAAGDRDRYAKHLAVDAVHIFPGWGVASRDAVLSGVADADAWKTFTIDDPEVIMLGDDSAALVYRTCAERETGPSYEAAITSVYRRRDGSWELAVHQQTPLSGG